MISIAEAISDLLFVRDTVVVPGMGAFVKKPVSAKVNAVANYFAMPTSEIIFDANLREDNELLVRYLSEKNEIPEDEAKKLLAMFVSDCFNTLKGKKKVVLDGIGSLSYDWADDMVFEQDKAVNYNSDAFGLTDFSLDPVLRFKTKEEIKEEIIQQQIDKNTPVTVDENAVHQIDTKDDEQDDEERHRGWLWVLLGLLLLAGVCFGLYYFKVIDFGRWMKPKRPVVTEPLNVTWPGYSVDWASMTRSLEAAESVEEPVVESEVTEVTNTVVQPMVEVPEAKIRIIAGCFAQEENAERLANTLRGMGYKYAFIEKRGSKWFVAFGRYATDEEASVALREIRANTEYKAWILK